MLNDSGGYFSVCKPQVINTKNRPVVYIKCYNVTPKWGSIVPHVAGSPEKPVERQ
jgi:hypothetical protein